MARTRVNRGHRGKTQHHTVGLEPSEVKHRGSAENVVVEVVILTQVGPARLLDLLDFSLRMESTFTSRSHSKLKNT